MKPYILYVHFFHLPSQKGGFMGKEHKTIIWFILGLLAGVVLTLGITWFLSHLQEKDSKSDPVSSLTPSEPPVPSVKTEQPPEEDFANSATPTISSSLEDTSNIKTPDASAAPEDTKNPDPSTGIPDSPDISGTSQVQAKPSESAFPSEAATASPIPETPSKTPSGGNSLKEPASSPAPQKATPSPRPTASAADKEQEKLPQPTAAASGNEITAPEWNSATAYTGGSRVLYQGSLYEAKWWTQNEIPGTSSGVWTYIASLTEDSKTSDSDGMEDSSGEDIFVERPAVSADDFKVVAYYPSWKTNQLGKVRFDIITHVIYAFAIPCQDGTLRPLENPETAKALIEKAHKNGAKALIAIGGWSYNDVPLEPTFREATSTQEKVKKLGDSILSLCTEYGFDGVDIDWEHPRVDDASHTQYEQLIVYLGNKLHAQGKLLTSAVLSGATPDGGVYYDAAAHSDKVLSTVDFLNVMAYDGGDGERHSSYDFAVACGTYWQETRGMEAARVVLGVPFYGRPSWSSYEDILALNPDAWNQDTSDVYGMSAWYNGISTIKKKTKYAAEHLGGIMIWEITQDTAELKKSLLTAIGEVAATIQ